MGQYDDDEHGAAYERARDYAEFANIVQHYDDTARGNHDDIDFDDIDHDGTEYDDNGNIVTPIDLDDFIAANPAIGVIIAVCDAIDEYGSFNGIPDDYEFGFTPDDEDDSPTCQFLLYIDLHGPKNRCTRYNPYTAPGDDDYDNGTGAAQNP